MRKLDWAINANSHSDLSLYGASCLQSAIYQIQGNLRVSDHYYRIPIINATGTICAEVYNDIQALLDAKYSTNTQNTQSSTPRVTLNFASLSPKMLFRILSKVSGAAFDVDPSIVGNVSLHYTNQPWNRVLFDIGHRYDWQIVRQGNVIVIRKKSGFRSLTAPPASK